MAHLPLKWEYMVQLVQIPALSTPECHEHVLKSFSERKNIQGERALLKTH